MVYTVNVSNSGAGPSGANTVITDDVPSGVTINSLAAGSGWSCTPLSGTGPGVITCTKAAGVSAGVTNELVATFNATKTAVEAVVNTATVTSGDSSCNAVPLLARCTSAVTVNGIPDLFPNFTYSVTTYNQNDARDVILNINELNGVPTSGVMQFFVPNSTGFTYTYAAGRTQSSILGVLYAVQNSDWVIQATSTGTLFTSKPGVVIPAGGTSSVVMTSTAITKGTKANITITITSQSGTEIRTNNNSVVLAQSVQR